jgi:hypothetical protein
MQKHTLIFSALATAALLTACGGSDHPAQTPPPASAPVPPPPPVPVASTIAIDFTKGIEGWSAGVADYHDGSEPSEAASGWSKLPPPVGGMGYYIVSHNNSDDVFTFTKRQFSGFVAGAKYKLTFEMTYATSAATGCFGVGGARGESIYMVGAANADEPKVVKQSDGRYRLNFDHGDQANSGAQGKVLGTQGIEGLSCDGNDFATATRKSDEAVTIQADKDGKFWIVLGTDSAFEGTNALYLLGAKVDVKPL